MEDGGVERGLGVVGVLNGEVGAGFAEEEEAAVAVLADADEGDAGLDALWGAADLGDVDVLGFEGGDEEVAEGVAADAGEQLGAAA